MWKRDELVRPTSGGGGAGVGRGLPDPVGGTTRSGSETKRAGTGVINIGPSVVIKGELKGSEDLTIEGRVEGTIELRQNALTIGVNGKIKADLFARSVVVLGQLVGNVIATEKVDIRDNGSIDGDITSPRVVISEGAHFRGSVDMKREGTAEHPAAGKPKAVSKTAPVVTAGAR